MEERGYCEHLWELSDQNKLLLHCISIYKLSGTSGMLILLTYVPHPFPAPFFTMCTKSLKSDVHNILAPP